MSDILCVTNRAACTEDFLVRVEKTAKAAPKGIILREKDLSEKEYARLAADVLKICRENGVPCIFHTFVGAALELGVGAIHLPLSLLSSLDDRDKKRFSVIGASCHSLEEAVIAQKLGATYITAGHIFATKCKDGVPPRGLGFLREVCVGVSVPVYAIGGISKENYHAVRECGAAGACVMSALMLCENTEKFLEELEQYES